MERLPMQTERRAPPLIASVACAPGEPPANPRAAAQGGPERAPMSPPEAARFRRVVEEQFDHLWRVLRGLGVPAASADDAAQQVFWIAAQKFDGIAPGSERAFLFSTAIGVAANVRRVLARSREVSDDHSMASYLDEAPNPEQHAVTKQARALLDRILDELDDDVRTVFVLFELEELTMAGIAALLGLPHGTVASRLRRAREQFQAATKRIAAGANLPGGSDEHALSPDGAAARS